MRIELRSTIIFVTLEDDANQGLHNAGARIEISKDGRKPYVCEIVSKRLLKSGELSQVSYRIEPEDDDEIPTQLAVEILEAVRATGLLTPWER